MAAKQLKPSSGAHESWYANYINHLLRLVFVVVMIAVAVVVYHYLLSDIISGRSHFFAFVALWLFSSYLVLPRLNRWLAKLYLPDYFIGRARTGDGLLGDPINLAFNGSKKKLMEAMEKADWHLADPLSFKASSRISYSAIFGKPYPTAPVSSLFLFHRQQDMAFEKEVDGIPRKRHHVRFWKTPEKWWLPGGYKAEWLAAATFDEHVGLSLFTGQITHKIDANVDQERDFVIATLRSHKVVSDVNSVKHFTTSYHARGGGGDMIHTDGALPFITLT